MVKLKFCTHGFGNADVQLWSKGNVFRLCPKNSRKDTLFLILNFLWLVGLLDFIVFYRSRRWYHEKVMFSQVSVCLSTGGNTPLRSQVLSLVSDPRSFLEGRYPTLRFQILPMGYPVSGPRSFSLSLVPCPGGIPVRPVARDRWVPHSG